MQLKITYKEIWRISAPIMLGSAAQNVIALSDAVLLYHRGEVEFAAIGFVGVFYITIAAIGYSLSRGGQILIARRMGERRPELVGPIFQTMLLFELLLAVVMWGIMRHGSAWIFAQFLDRSPAVYQKCLEYIHYRSFGIFFSYAGVALIALYSGIARPWIILVDTVILAIINLGLNYALIFGRFGLPEMGIGGSGLASSIAEGIAFVVFAGYVLLDKKNRSLQLFSGLHWDWALAQQQLKLSMSVVAQAAVGQGSWIFFFGMVENLGERALAISNLARTVYLMLSIPLWGFASGANTLISNLIGQKRYRDVLTATWRAGFLCWAVTIALAIPVLFRPDIFLYPLLGAQDSNLMQEARPVFLLLLGLLSLSTFGTVSFNGLAGAGATWFGLKIQTSSVILYLSYIYYVTNFTQLGVFWVWVGEILYWMMMLSWMIWYLRSYRWRRLKL